MNEKLMCSRCKENEVERGGFVYSKRVAIGPRENTNLCSSCVGELIIFCLRTGRINPDDLATFKIP